MQEQKTNTICNLNSANRYSDIELKSDVESYNEKEKCGCFLNADDSIRNSKGVLQKLHIVSFTAI